MHAQGAVLQQHAQSVSEEGAGLRKAVMNGVIEQTVRGDGGGGIHLTRCQGKFPPVTFELWRQNIKTC